ncbi:MAG: hypothetical protein ACPGNT_06775 [Rhodospirillales bacterium]
MAYESGAILTIAEALSHRLRREDPLAKRIELTKLGYLGCCFAGVLRVLLGRC